MNVESIAEVKVLVGLPGRIRAVERPADHGGHQERHQPVPRLGSTTSSATPTGTRTAGRTSSTATRSPSPKQRDWGYSIGGPIGKPGGNNKLFFFYSHEFAPRTGGNDMVRFRVPTALERQGDFSQTLDNNGALYPYIKDPQPTAPAPPPTQAAASGRRRARPIPASRLYQTGLNILKMWPMPNVEQRPGLGYNYESPAGREHRCWQPAVRVDYQAFDVRLRVRRAAAGPAPATSGRPIPGLERSRRCAGPRHHGRGHGQLQPVVRRCSSRTYRRRNSSTRSPTATRSPLSNRANAGLPDSPMLFRSAGLVDADYQRLLRVFGAASSPSTPTAGSGCRRTSRGAAASPTRRRTRSPAA